MSILATFRLRSSRCDVIGTTACSRVRLCSRRPGQGPPPHLCGTGILPVNPPAGSRCHTRRPAPFGYAPFGFAQGRQGRLRPDATFWTANRPGGLGARPR